MNIPRYPRKKKNIPRYTALSFVRLPQCINRTKHTAVKNIIAPFDLIRSPENVDPSIQSVKYCFCVVEVLTKLF